MGLLRSGGVIFLSTLLFLTLFLGNLILTLSWSLERETLQPNLENFADTMIEKYSIDQMIEENYELIEAYCTEYDEFNISEQGVEIVIPCTVIQEGPEEIVEFGRDKLIYQIYFGEYNCEYWECIKTENKPFVLVSEKSQEYWSSKYYLALMISIILFGLIFLIAERKKSAITITGLVIILAAIPYRKLNWAMSLIPAGEIRNMVLMFFTRSYNVFLIMMIIGLVVLLTGISLEFFGAGMKLKKMFTRKDKEDNNSVSKEDVKKIVRNEVEKESKKSKNKIQRRLEK